jgi:GNAT superfamily N-acetyltransferase
MPAYEISTDPARLDVDAIHAFLTQSYWSPGIPRATVARAIANSLCFGVFWQGQQVGFAPMVTDKTTFAYLCDVYVLEEHRGHGVSKQLMAHVMQHPDLQGLRRMMLATRDAHGLYTQYGFTALTAPDRIMEIVRPDIYLQG